MKDIKVKFVSAKTARIPRIIRAIRVSTPPTQTFNLMEIKGHVPQSKVVFG